MYLLGKENLINLEEVTVLYINVDASIKAKFKQGEGCQIVRYEDMTTAKKALELIAEDFRLNKNIIFLPDKQTLEVKIRGERQKLPSITGKKQKGHGGS